MSKRVVITGTGVLSPIGNSTPEFLDGLKKGSNGISSINLFDSSPYSVHLAGELKITWLEFLNKLAALENAEEKLKVVDNSDWILVPPHDSSLNIKKIITLGLRPTKFDLALERIRLQIKVNSNSLKISI